MKNHDNHQIMMSNKKNQSNQSNKKSSNDYHYGIQSLISCG
jgi:hypothetical protein